LITDFGASSHGTSNKSVKSAEGRGTSGYRAPELVLPSSRFTTKVDVWGLGCILFELATRKQAFKCDWNVQNYYQSQSTLKPSIAGLPNILQSHLDEITDDLLHRTPRQRPRVSELLPLFQSYIEIIYQSARQGFNHRLIAPSYPEWKTIVITCTKRHKLFPIFKFFRTEKDITAEISSVRLAVNENPLDEKYRSKLKAICEKNNDLQFSISVWFDLVNRQPSNQQLLDELVLACEQMNDFNFSIAIWRKLIEKHPTNVSLITAYMPDL